MNADILKQIPRHEALILIKAVGLRKKYENVLIMRYYDDMSIDEISDKLCIEYNSVQKQITRARKQFDKFTGGQ